MVQVNLAEIYTKMQSAVAFTFAAAESLDNNEADSGLKIFGCRINSIEVAVEVCQKAMKLGGGNAYAKRLPLEISPMVTTTSQLHFQRKSFFIYFHIIFLYFLFI